MYLATEMKGRAQGIWIRRQVYGERNSIQGGQLKAKTKSN